MLTRLKVSGFKNLVDVDIRFGPFTCVAGTNGVGKSNLFVHRDAERELLEKRVAEIHSVVSEAAQTKLVPPVVCVIPVRMQEAWFLFDESALRRAAGNPNGKQPLTKSGKPPALPGRLSNV
jgi:predicted ATPase